MHSTRREVLAAAAAPWRRAACAAAPQGRFWREWWFQPDEETARIRFRVNSPETSLHPEFGSRPEARSSGMMRIFMPEDPRLLEAVELYCELWGGHPGTANRRVSINGRGLYRIPENGTAAGHCTHLYPSIRLSRSDVMNGWNAVQFACDQGNSFWGHFIVDNACLRAALPPNHPDLRKLDLTGFSASVCVEPGQGETLLLSLEASRPERIAEVHYQGFHAGYDENGNGEARDWHGFTKNRRPEAWISTSGQPPFQTVWDVSMVPDRTAAVRALVAFRDIPGLLYQTAAVEAIPLPERVGRRVVCAGASHLPAPFWSRAGRRLEAEIELPVEPRRVERAHLHVVVWDGGRGTVRDPFRLNGNPMEVCGTGRHDVIYTVRELEPSLLRRKNRVELFSDTTHHGIEVLLPGPTLILRAFL